MEPPLHLEVDGAGPVVLLMHGFAGSARNFAATTRALRAHWRVVRFDARGHGRSGAPDDPGAYTPSAFVADVGRVLDQVGAERAVVGGLSMGASVALRFALAQPARTRALVLAAFPGRDGLAAVARQFADAIAARGLDAAGEEFVWGARSGLDPASARVVRQGFLEHPPHGLAHTLRGLVAVAPARGPVAVPTLVLVGAEDPSLAASRALAAELPHARLVVIEDAGHVVNLARPREFNAALADFLHDLPP